MRSARNRSGFTLVEALVAVVLVGIGISAVLGGLGAMTRSQVHVREMERMQRLAIQKYDELVATGQLTGGTSLSGDFSDWNVPGYSWDVAMTDTGVDSLQAVKLTVHDSNDLQTSVSNLLYSAPATATTGGTTTGGGTNAGATGGGQ